MMAISIAIIMHHASDGIIWHVLIVIIGNQAPYSYGSNITSEHHPCVAQWWSVRCARLGSQVRVPPWAGVLGSFGFFPGKVMKNHLK